MNGRLWRADKLGAWGSANECDGSRKFRVTLSHSLQDAKVHRFSDSSVVRVGGVDEIWWVATVQKGADVGYGHRGHRSE
jgi:hypothetical protein